MDNKKLRDNIDDILCSLINIRELIGVVERLIAQPIYIDSLDNTNAQLAVVAAQNVMLKSQIDLLSQIYNEVCHA